MAALRQGQCVIVEEVSDHENSSRDPGDSAGDWPAAGQLLRKPQEPDGDKAGSGKLGVVAGGRGPAAARGPDSEPGGDGERVCGARGDCFWGYRQGALRFAQREYSGGQDCR